MNILYVRLDTIKFLEKNIGKTQMAAIYFWNYLLE